MSTIVLRSVKGTPLTNTEVDDNFSNLNTDKIQIGGTYSSGTANGVLFLSGSKVLTTGSALTFDGASLGVNGVSVGRGAGAVSTNTAVGAGALQANTEGTQNVAVGSSASGNNSTGSSNTTVGVNSLSTNSTGSNNVAVGNSALNAVTTSNNTAVGYQAGVSITTGNSNVVIGSYSGNQGGLDIRTSSNNIVVSDGDGEPRLVYYNTAPLTKITGVLTHNFTDTQSKSQITLYDTTNGNTEIASGYSTADFVVATGGTTGNLAYSARANGYFVTNTGVVAIINTTFTVGSNTYTVTASSSEGYIYCTPDPIGEAATGTLVGVKYATEGFRVLDNRTAQFKSTVGVGGTAGSSSGAGITFPATQSASSNANTLDDYEEGDWTPTSNTPNISISVIGTARYTKIGRQVSTYFYATITNSTGSNINGILVAGLPFASLGYAPAFTYYSPSLSRDIYGGYVESAQAYIYSGVTIVPGENSVMLAASYFVS